MAFDRIKKRYKDWEAERKLTPSEKAEKVAARRWAEMERLDKESKELEARNRLLRDSEADLSKAKVRREAAERGEHRKPLQVEREVWAEHDKKAPKVHHKRYPTPKLKRAKRIHHKTRRTSLRRLVEVAEANRPTKPSKPYIPRIADWNSNNPDIASWMNPKGIGGFKF